MTGLYHLADPLLRWLDPETAHRLAIFALRAGLTPKAAADARPELAARVLGLSFPNPVGLAAGFDKDGEVPDALLSLGFGFVELGTVTPRAQPGNPGPRLFRLAEDRAIINRLGFNNDGHAALRRRLSARRRSGEKIPGVVGVNIGANRDSADKMADYVEGLKVFSPLADYLTINISSPNTKGLRRLQDREALDRLLGRLSEARRSSGAATPVLVKIAPDLDRPALEDIVAACLENGVDGLVVANTTLARPALHSATRGETGGLSGRPLFRRATRMLAQAYDISQGRLTLIGVGGVDSAQAAWDKICAGASLIQLYTGLVYEGPGLIGAICRGLSNRLAAHGFSGISQAVGSGIGAWLDGQAMNDDAENGG